MGILKTLLSKSKIRGDTSMIFVTVGNHSLHFDRLIKKADELASKGKINNVFIQTGCSKYKPVACKFEAFIDQGRFNKMISMAEVVIAHAGAGTIMTCLRYNKVPVVVPRRKKFGEVINDHQLELAHALSLKGKVIEVKDLDNLPNYIAKARSVRYESNNQKTKIGIINLIEYFLNEYEQSKYRPRKLE